MPTTVETPIPAGQPLYLRMALRIEAQIQTGELEPGVRLPSYGRMRKQYGANPVTLERAYGVLEKKGLIRREANRGIFVAKPKPSRTSCLIGVVAQQVMRRNPYYIHLLAGIQEEAQQRRAELLIVLQDEPSPWDDMRGCIVMVPDEHVVSCLPDRVPCVTVMHSFAGVPSVTVDDSAGIRAAVRHLAGLGHRRIGFLSRSVQSGHHYLSWRRVVAYREALRECGIVPDDRWLRRLQVLHEYSSFVKLGWVNMRWWLEEDWEEAGCTALLVQNDETAVGVLRAFEEAGIEVPRQVSLVGFDGTELGACVRPRLTTITVPLEKVGAAAVEFLLSEGHGSDSTSIVFESGFLQRDSTVRPCLCR